MKRGDLVTVAVKGPYTGKPRPALIVQSDRLQNYPSIVVVLLSSAFIQSHYLVRIQIEPTPENGLKQTSQIAIDHIVTVPRESIGKHIGQVSPEIMWTVDRALSIFLDLI